MQETTQMQVTDPKEIPAPEEMTPVPVDEETRKRKSAYAKASMYIGILTMLFGGFGGLAVVFPAGVFGFVLSLVSRIRGERMSGEAKVGMIACIIAVVNMTISVLVAFALVLVYLALMFLYTVILVLANL